MSEENEMTEYILGESFQCLTKENFWNELYAKYPGEVQQFCDWVDKYKQSINWVLLFGQSEMTVDMAPKFHEIPIAMQIGIFLQYVSESGARYSIELEVGDADDFNRIPLAIKEFFAWEHQNSYDDKMAGKYMDSDG
jgi:hypothetical protein